MARTVRSLINALSKFDPNADVIIGESQYDWDQVLIVQIEQEDSDELPEIQV